jgi:hypothetical protein
MNGSLQFDLGLNTGLGRDSRARFGYFGCGLRL